MTQDLSTTHNAVVHDPLNRAWYFFALVYLFFDYVRPQSFLPVLGALRPALITILILSLFAIAKGRGVLFRSAQMRLLWLFIGILVLLGPFAHNRGRAFFITQSMIMYVPFIVAIIGCVRSTRRLKHYLYYLMMIMTYMALYMITHKGMGPGNYFIDENDVSLFIDMLLPFGYFLFIQEKNRWRKLFLALALVLSVGAVVVSFSRGGFVGLCAAFAVVWLFSPRKIISLLIIAALGTGMYLFSDKSYWKEMDTITDTKEATAKARILYWKASVRMFKAHPLGVGGFNFPYLHSRYQAEEWRGRSMWGIQAHSIWFTVLPETGIEGTVVFLLLIFANLKNVFFIKKNFRGRNDPEEKFLYYLSLAFLSSLAGFFTAASFISVLYYAHYWYLCGLIAAATAMARHRLDQRAEIEAALPSSRTTGELPAVRPILS